LFAVIPLLAGCDDAGVLASPVALEPLSVQGGQFFPGPLPTGTGPKVDFINTPATVFPAGSINKTLTGDADMGATAVLLRFADLGSGYWSVPIGVPDVTMSNGALTWSATCNFSESIPAGHHPLVFNAIDANGNAGPAPGVNQTETLSFLPVVPKGDVVISLTWDTAADLDLHVVAPDGTELDPQHPTTASSRAVGAPVPPGTAVLNRDANANCIKDPSPEEDAIFADPPLPGTYVVRVDMFSSCGVPAADFVVTLRVRGKVMQTVEGVLRAQDADGGGPGSGLLVMTLDFCGCGNADAGTPCTTECADF
jgi:hypothetical protein